MIWRIVDNDLRQASADLVASWGYFRAIEVDEVEGSSWFAYCRNDDQPIGFLWYTDGPEDDSLAAHTCTKPSDRGRISSPNVMRAVELFAGILGANRVYSVLDDSVPRVEVIKRWLRKRGWTDHQYGMCRKIGE